MSDRQIVDLLDRAAMVAPPMHVSAGSVLVGGRRRVRRRRLQGAGVAVAAASIAGVTWVGFGQVGGATTARMVPAATTWDTTEPVEVENLFRGLEGTDASFPRSATLERPRGAAATLTLDYADGRDGAAISGEQLPGGVQVFRGEGVTVVAWVAPDNAEPGSAVVWSNTAGNGSSASSDSLEIEEGKLEFLAIQHQADADIRVDDVLFHNEAGVLAASGTPVQSGVLNAGDASLRVFSAPELGVWGSSDPRGLMVNPGSLVGGYHAQVPTDGRGWGSDDLAGVHGRLPATATDVRLIGPAGTPIDGELDTLRLGEDLFAFATSSEDSPELAWTASDGSDMTLQNYRDMPPAEQRLTVGQELYGVELTKNRVVLTPVDGRGTILAPSTPGRAHVSLVNQGQVVVVPGWQLPQGAEPQVIIARDDGSQTWQAPDDIVRPPGTDVVVLGLDQTVSAKERVAGLGHVLPDGSRERHDVDVVTPSN